MRLVTIPQKRLGIVILVNRGRQPATRIGRRILLDLSRNDGPVTEEGSERLMRLVPTGPGYRRATVVP